jgi:hypothetical protein
MASGTVDKRLPFRLSLSKSFCILFYLISLKAKSKDLAVPANTLMNLNLALSALFVIAIVAKSLFYYSV